MSEVFGALSLPGNIAAINRIGRFIAHKIRIYQKAPEILAELKHFGVELYKGQFYLDIKIAQVFSTDFDDLTVKNHLNSQIERLKAGLDEAQMILSRSYDDKGDIDKMRFTLSVEKQLSKNLEQLRSWQGEFYSFVNSLNLLGREKESVILTHNHFLPSVNDQGDYCQRVSGTLHAYIGHAEWKKTNGEMHYIPILFEKHDVGARIVDEVLDTLLYLAVHLPRHQSPDTGILRCLGYRKEPKPELIFEIPPEHSKPQTLRSFLDGHGGHDTDNDGISKTDRLKFAHRISAAISNAQEAGLIHKNVRPDSILVFKDEGAQEDSSRCGKAWMPYLTNWTLARTEQMLSYRQGDDDWERNLYRHPQRQGLHVEDRYHAGHDIYSLGVCLLEIGLGESLIVRDDEDEGNLCKLFHKEAMKMRLVSSDGASNACRNLKPREVARVLRGLSEAELPSRMGVEYRLIVQQCLQCIEQGFGPIRDFVKNQDYDLDSAFKELVLQPLKQLN